MKTVSIREMNDGVSKVVREAQEQPVLIRQRDEPVVWMVSARDLQRVAGTLSPDGDFYRHVLELLAVDLADRGVLSMGQAARLAGLSLSEFYELCDRLGVAVLRESEEGVAEQVDAFERWLRSSEVETAT